MKIIKSIMTLALAAVLLASCEKYRDIADATYPEQTLYLPAAAAGVSANGIYSINAVAVPGYAFRYVADVPNKKLNIPLLVYRSGVNTKGSAMAAVSANADTVARLLTTGRFPTGTEVLPADKYSLPNSVTVVDGQGGADFTLSVDLNFLLANPAKKYALGVALSSSGKGLGSSLAIILIDPSFLTPAAAFTASVSGRTVTFVNSSANAVGYSWNYGDGSAPSTASAASYTYTAAGTYTITLTATGALGTSNPSSKTVTVTVL